MYSDKTNLVVYHGSDVLFGNPQLKYAKPHKDFGKGFYVTTDENQAKRFAEIVARRNGSSDAFVMQFNVQNFDDLLMFEFDDTNEDWLKCIVGNRTETHKSLADAWKNYEVITGKIADDDTALVINAYMAGVYGQIGTESAYKMAVKMFKPQKLKNQLCFKTENAIDKLTFIEYESWKLKE